MQKLARLQSSVNAFDTYSTVLQGALDNMKHYADCIVLTRVGGFYELYFHQAEDLHVDLGLKRSFKETKLGPIAMAGFPFFQLNKYLKILVHDMNRHVALSEEFPRDQHDTSSKNIFERRVARIITPGTLIDEEFVDDSQTNYLLAIFRSDDGQYGLAWADLGTGDFFTQQSTQVNLLVDVERLNPVETITNFGLPRLPHTRVKQGRQFSSLWRELSDDDFTIEESFAGSMLLEYVSVHTPGMRFGIKPIKKSKTQCMRLDSRALECLEIRRTIRDNAYRGTLLHSVNRTVTRSGARLLSEMLACPSTDIAQITTRLDLVNGLHDAPGVCEDLTNLLKLSGDAVRILQRFNFGRGDVEDLLVVARMLEVASKVSVMLSSISFATDMVRRFTAVDELCQQILSAIDEAGVSRQSRENAEAAAQAMQEVLSADRQLSNRQRRSRERETSYIMKVAASANLAASHARLATLTQAKRELELKLRSEHDMNTLTLRSLPGLGHIAHVKNRDATNAAFNSKQHRTVASTRSTRAFVIEEWSLLGAQIELEQSRISNEEISVFRDLRRQVLQNETAIRNDAALLDELDVAVALATISREKGWVRPRFAGESKIDEGRHPVVEAALQARGQTFVPNSVNFLSPVYLITGPNMGGKSTFLRQTAIIQILAQIGSFVPATAAQLSMVDAIYSRVGSADSLYNNESTFFVEMKETASILRNATENSLVIMDEVGRGTSAKDGLAIAYAILCALKERGCKTLFATHFSELATMLNIGSLCTNMIERDGRYTFTHQIRHGVCQDSHGLKVAQIAGIDATVLQVARRRHAALSLANGVAV